MSPPLLRMLLTQNQRAGFPVLIELAPVLMSVCGNIKNYHHHFIWGVLKPCVSALLHFFVLIVSRVFLLCLLFGVVYTQKQSRLMYHRPSEAKWERARARMCWYANDLYTCSRTPDGNFAFGEKKRFLRTRREREQVHITSVRAHSNSSVCSQHLIKEMN